LELYSFELIDPSPYVPFGLGFLGFGALFFFALWRWFAHHQNQKKLLQQEQKQLSVGTATISGQIYPLQDPLPLLTVKEELKRNSRRQSFWRKISRELSGKPFQLLTQHGEKVRVEAREQETEFQIIREPNHGETINKIRTSTFTFEEGETVWVKGSLLQLDSSSPTPFRGEPSWVMQPPPNVPLFLLKEAPSEEHKRFVRSHRNWALGLGFLYFVVLFLCSSYFLLFFFGRPAVLQDLHLDSTGSKEYSVSGSYLDPVSGEARSLYIPDLWLGVARDVEKGQRKTLPVLVAPGVEQIGTEARMSIWSYLFLLFGLFFGVLLYWVGRPEKKAHL
jgi:hypothetical protein